MVEDSKVGKYLKYVVINGIHRVVGLIDGGSSICTIRKIIAQCLGLTPPNGKLSLYAFGNVHHPAVICNAKVNTELEVDHVKAKVELWAVDNDPQTAVVIIGRFYTDLHHIAYDVLQLINEKRTALKLSDDVEIKRNKINVIRVEAAEQNYNLAISGMNNANVSRGKVIGYARPCNDTNCKARIMTPKVIELCELNLPKDTQIENVQKLIHSLKSYANHEESDDSLSENKDDEEYDSETFTEETADADKLRPIRIRRKPSKYKDFHMSITFGYKFELDTDDDVGQERPTVVIKKDAGGKSQIEAVVVEPQV
ncbi:hypothetical protein RN001_003389 [Aquatica leii]|uniref:Uncharacterized protein n=1 Tax=Aquatica leii TaxID=1421715 RepID=A0AAN7QP27_9COLE|nr:hypothetical protein RN001_003389 [Aquatica leii]